jgi:hypothetical protein
MLPRQDRSAFLAGLWRKIDSRPSLWDFAVSRYRYWISVHDSARDEERQLASAQRVFGAMKAQAWPALLSFNLQSIITVYP